MQLPPQVTPTRHAGHDALRLVTRHASATLALHGAQLLSWQPAGQREVLWLSPQALPEPAAIRGGVPLCWPWFARQGQSASVPQHGLVRTLSWQISAIHASSDDEISLSLQPCAQLGLDDQGAARLAELAPGLHVSLRITLGQTLSQTLHTRNLGNETFPLTQALHSYLAVGDAAQATIDGLADLAYQDKLRNMAAYVQHDPFTFALDAACDRIYHHPGAAQPKRYTLNDPVWQRRIIVETQGSESVVVWNPGPEGARQIADMPDEGWRDFVCIEASNAGPDVVALAPGAQHWLSQKLSIK